MSGAGSVRWLNHRTAQARNIDKPGLRAGSRWGMFNDPAQETFSVRASQASSDDHFENEIDAIRLSISADDEHLELARSRTNAVRKAALTFAGALRTYGAGSLFHETVNRPVSDGDCGVVLDRRSYPNLGPDSDFGGGPTDVVFEMAGHVLEILKQDEDLGVAYAETSKRAIVFHFNDDGTDDPNPSVDLIVGLTRAEGDGLWIPNTETNEWDPSHPEGHTTLLTNPPKELRVHRARLIRLAKEVVKTNEPSVLISFNIEALALDLVTEVSDLGDGLRALFGGMASKIEDGLTPDPCGVSADIKLPDGITNSFAAERLRYFESKLAEAQTHGDDSSYVKTVLAEIFPAHYANSEQQQASAPKSDLAKALASNDVGSSAVTSAFGITSAPKPVRSFGNAPR